MTDILTIKSKFIYQKNADLNSPQNAKIGVYFGFVSTYNKHSTCT
jgi:hypothetical protein